MEWFSGKEIVAGIGYHGWASHFYPPLFSLLIGVGGLIGSGFLAGKVISILSASLLLLVAYDLAREFCGSEGVALWTQAFLALSPLYLYESLQADNHLLDALLFNCGLLLFLRSAKEPRVGPLLLVGVVCGLAGLTRYTSYSLVFLPLSFLIFQKFRRAVILAASFFLGFILASLPWWYYNDKLNGAPTYNWNYLNVCVGVFGWYTNSLQVIWHWAADPSINGVTDILLGHPSAYVHNVIRNLPLCAGLLMSSAGALALFVAPGVLEGLCRLRPYQSVAVFGVLPVSVVVVSQAYLNSYYLLPWTVLIVALSVAFLLAYLRRLEEKFLVLPKYQVGRLVMGLLLAFGMLLCGRELKAYRNETESYRPSVDADEIAVAMNRYDPEIKSKVIMALDPARAYYVGAKYLATPFEYGGTVDGLVCYKDVSPRLRHYAPKYPSNMDEANLRADYLVYTRPEQARGLYDPPQFAFLMDPKSDKIPKNFKPVYQSTNAVVYEVSWGQPAASAK